MVELAGVASQSVPQVWPHIEHMVDEAERDWPFTGDGLKQNCMEQKSQLWIVCDDGRIIGFCVTEIQIHERYKIGFIVALGGQGAGKIADCVDQLESFYIHAGCQKSVIVARPGWKKFLPQYNQSHILLEKGLCQ